MGSINSLTRKNIRKLKPYSSARDEYSGGDALFFDANENPYFGPLNRYPDPRQMALKKVISRVKRVLAERIFVGNGSDEAIDLLVRAFCEPGEDNIVSVDPTYGMYEVTAAINGVAYRKVSLGDDFRLASGNLMEKCDRNTRIIFLCSPNNPTGNSFGHNEVMDILNWFEGILVIDEAYIDFSGHPGFLPEIGSNPRLVVLQTLSKAWGRAGIRMGMAFADKELISVMNRIKPPYNVNTLTINEALSTLGRADEIASRVRELISNRERLKEQLGAMESVRKVYPSDANFLLVQVDNAAEMYHYLTTRNIIVRDRSRTTGCNGCLRITIGTERENGALLDAMGKYEIEKRDETPL